MFVKVRRFLRPPVFKDEEQSRIASLIHLISLTLLAASILTAISSLFFGYWKAAWTLTAGTAGMLGALWLTQRGHLRAASRLVLLMFLGVLNCLLCMGDGIHDIAVVAYPVVLVVAGLLLDKRAFIVYTLLAILSLQGIIYGELNGLVVNKFTRVTLYSDLATVSVILFVTAVSARLLSDNITKNIARARSAQHALAESNRELLRVNDELIRVNDELTREITERKQAEEERALLLTRVQEQAQHVQQIMDTVPEGMILLDANEQIVLANPLGVEYLVTLADAKVGDTLTHLGDRPLAGLLTSPPRGLWHEVKTAGPSRRIFETIARPVEDGPDTRGWVLVIRDVTREREIQRCVQQQERLAAVGQLAAGIAHDFNNVLATIVLYAQMSARMEGASARIRERMEVVNQQAQHATRLIQQVLDFSRRAVLERCPMDLLVFLKEQVKLLERILPESIEIKLTYGPDEYVVNADPTRMQQAIMNLVVNARDAMPQGGELRIALERTQIEHSKRAPLPEMSAGEWVHVAVTDSGTGIPSGVLSHIYDPFFTTKAPRQGTGLGLSQVYGIVRQHEGHINVTTKVGEGTTFTLYLPALQTSRPQASTQDVPALTKGNGETILVVEDNASLREAMVQSLRELDYQVLAAANGRGALDVFEQHVGKVALVLSDTVMPGMGGRALLHNLRMRGWQGQAILATGHPLHKKDDDLQSGGIVEWLQKPVKLEHLAQVVARALSQPTEQSRQAHNSV